MPFVPKKQAFNAHINEVVLGVGDKATAIGGQNVLPFHTFDAEIKNAPKIGVELTDLGMAEYTMPGEKAFYAGCTTVAEMAKRAETLEGASFICLHLEGADPNGLNKSVEECVQLAKDVADATTLPLVIMGCKNIEKDTELFNKIAFWFCPRATRTTRPSSPPPVWPTARRSARNLPSTSTSPSSSTPSSPRWASTRSPSS